jgi:uncharacterized Zn finger protein (UPF0148 family)
MWFRKKKDPCPKCGSAMIRWKGRIYCPECGWWEK